MSARDEFFHVMGANGFTLSEATAIYRAAQTVQRLSELACNRELLPAEHRRAELAEQCIRVACARVNARPDFSGDPRGYVVKLKLPGGQHNDWGGEGLYCVPAKGYTAKQMERIAP